MKILFKKYWWSLLIIITLPIIVNLIIICPSILKVGGNPNDWLIFFGGYFGCIISASVSFIILSRTIQSNEKENKSNRILQVKVLSAELAQCYLNDIRNILSRLICSYQNEDLVLVSSSLEKDTQTILQTIKRISTNIRVENTNLRLALNALNDDISKSFLKEVEDFHYSFRDMIVELVWMAEYNPSNLQFDEWDNDLTASSKQIEKDVVEYLNNRMKDNPETDKYDDAHIWNIFKKYNYAHDKFHDIWCERVLYLDISNFEEISIKYISSELESIREHI